MGKIIKDQSGKVLAVNGSALQVDATIDSNIVAGNIKKDVSILGVTGTYEGGGVVPVVEKDVNFYDYDGTLLYSYTAQEFANLSAMPANPTHQGLTAQGWNWSLADAKAYVASYGKLIIGQMYITDDGKTRLYIHIDSADRATLPLYWGQMVANGVTINWGDGSAEETFEGTGKKNTTHTYSAAGDYVITLAVSSGTTAYFGAIDSSYCIFGPLTNTNLIYINTLKRVEVGSGFESLGLYAFKYCRRLSSITMPNSVISLRGQSFYYCSSLLFVTIPSNVTIVESSMFESCFSLLRVSFPSSVTSINDRCFYSCYALKSITMPNASIGSSIFENCNTLLSVTIPSGITSISQRAFSSCFALSSVTIPSGVTSISTNVFSACQNFASLVIPNSVTSISNYAFSDCQGMKKYILKPIAPPTLGSYVFYNMPTDAQIIVPTESVETYKAASNWSNLSSKIIGGAENY